MKKNKFILFVLALILLAGIIIVCIKGFNVSLDLRAHDTLKFIFDEEFKKQDITKICDEVFKNKKYEIKTVEVFSDAVYIISSEITENEEISLLEKLNELYPSKNAVISNEENDENGEEITEKTILDELEKGAKYNFYHDSEVRIRDIIKPYIVPSIISAVIVIIYIAIKYRKLNNGNSLITICKILLEMLIVLFELISIVAIIRIPFTRTLIPIIMFIIVVYLCVKFQIFENKLKELD